MSPSTSPSSQSSQQDPFNHYNTEFVKLDANNWQEDSGFCQPPELEDFVCLKVNENSEDEEVDMSSLINASPFKQTDTINVKFPTGSLRFLNDP